MSNQTAIFAAGCFWCIEAVYNRLKGVHNATSGYINGHTPAPTYAEVCSGSNGHAEAVKIEFDPEIISYRTLLEVLFTLHDPPSSTAKATMWARNTAAAFIISMKRKRPKPKRCAGNGGSLSAADCHRNRRRTNLSPRRSLSPTLFCQQSAGRLLPNGGGAQVLKARTRYADLWRG